MKNFTNLNEAHNYQYESGFLGTMLKSLSGEEKITTEANSPSKHGRIWLLESSDSDETVSAVLGKPITELTFNGVIYDEENDCYVCLHAVADSACHSLIVPDKSWVPPAWRNHLTSLQ